MSRRIGNGYHCRSEEPVALANGHNFGPEDFSIPNFLHYRSLALKDRKDRLSITST